jgi:hypothetical protein
VRPRPSPFMLPPCQAHLPGSAGLGGVPVYGAPLDGAPLVSPLDPVRNINTSLKARGARRTPGRQRMLTQRRAQPRRLQRGATPVCQLVGVTGNPCSPGAACRLRPRGATAASARTRPRQPTEPAERRNESALARRATLPSSRRFSLQTVEDHRQERACGASCGWRKRHS